MNKIIGERTNKGLIVILLITIIGLISYIVYDELNEKNKSAPKETKSNVVKEEKIESRDLTIEELNNFKDHFNSQGINGFLIQEFTDSKNIDLYVLLYNGIGKQTVITEEEKYDFLKATDMEELYTDLLKITDDDIKTFLKSNVDLDHTKGEKIKNFDYLAKYDAYYNAHGDTNYMEIGNCTSGKIDKNGNYIINCEAKYDAVKTTTVLRKQNYNYIFISNKCLENCDYLPGNIK